MPDGPLRVKQQELRMSKSRLLCPKLRTSKGRTEFYRDGPKRDLGAGGAGRQIQCGSRDRLRLRKHVNDLVGHAVHDQHLILHFHVQVVTQFRYLRQNRCW